MQTEESPPVPPMENNFLGASLPDREPGSSLQERFRAPRDGDAMLYEPTHTYFVKNTQVHNSVTKMIKQHWPQFQTESALANYAAWKANKSSKYGMLIDYLQVVEQRDDEFCKQAIAALWSKRGALASQLGTDMHRDFQYIVEGKEPPQGETQEVKQFRPWLKTFCERYSLQPWRAEWIVYYEHKGTVVVAGQVDLVLKHTERDEYWCSASASLVPSFRNAAIACLDADVDVSLPRASLC